MTVINLGIIHARAVMTETIFDDKTTASGMNGSVLALKSIDNYGPVYDHRTLRYNNQLIWRKRDTKH